MTRMAVAAAKEKEEDEKEEDINEAKMKRD
jgi:hypothetical protein